MRLVDTLKFLYRALPCVLLSLTLITPVFADNTADSSVSVAVVNVRYLLQHAPQSDAASNELKKRFLSKEKDLDAEAEAIRAFEESIRKSEDKLSREEKIEKERELRSRKRTQNRALEDYREDLRLAKSAALDDVQKMVFEAIDEVRKVKKIDIVIQDYVSASERVDITKAVIVFLAEKLKQDKANEPLKK